MHCGAHFLRYPRMTVTFSASETGQSYGLGKRFILCHARTLAFFPLSRRDSLLVQRQVKRQTSYIVMQIFIGIPKMKGTFSAFEVRQGYG